MLGRVALVAGLGILIAVAGCGGGGTTKVSGSVAVDGKPLEKGVISFAPADGTGVAATAEVIHGMYSLRATPGKNRVQLSAPVVVGRRKESNASNAAEVEITEESLPAKYNAASELVFDVPSGGGTKDWSVESKLKK